MNQLVDLYDSINSRQNHASTLQAGSLEYIDTLSIIEQLKSELTHIVRGFFTHNSITINHLAGYDVTEDIAQCRLYLHISHHRNPTLIITK